MSDNFADLRELLRQEIARALDMSNEAGPSGMSGVDPVDIVRFAKLSKELNELDKGANGADADATGELDLSRLDEQQQETLFHLLQVIDGAAPHVLGAYETCVLCGHKAK